MVIYENIADPAEGEAGRGAAGAAGMRARAGGRTRRLSDLSPAHAGISSLTRSTPQSEAPAPDREAERGRPQGSASDQKGSCSFSCITPIQ